MGKLKQHVMEGEESHTEKVMFYYGNFLVGCMEDRTMPNTGQDAINAIHWAMYFEGKEISRLQIEYILKENTESLYEDD